LSLDKTNLAATLMFVNEAMAKNVFARNNFLVSTYMPIKKKKQSRSIIKARGEKIYETERYTPQKMYEEIFRCKLRQIYFILKQFKNASCRKIQM